MVSKYVLSSLFAASVMFAAPASAQTFSPAGGAITGSGFGEINGNSCDALISGNISSTGDYVDVVFQNTSVPCNDYEVSARVYANGNVSNVNVKALALPGQPVICSSGAAVYTGATVLSNLSATQVEAYLPANINVGFCNLGADVVVGTAQVNP